MDSGSSTNDSPNALRSAIVVTSGTSSTVDGTRVVVLAAFDLRIEFTPEQARALGAGLIARAALVDGEGSGNVQ